MSGLQKGEYQETVGRRSLTEMNDDKNGETEKRLLPTSLQLNHLLSSLEPNTKRQS